MSVMSEHLSETIKNTYRVNNENPDITLTPDPKLHITSVNPQVPLAPFPYGEV